MKAIILAAGRGERMRPLTDRSPKPLLYAGKKRLIEYHLQALAAFGVKEIVINISYLAEQFAEALGDGSNYDLNIHYSLEPEVLETGGGIYQALQSNLLGPDPFIVISADVWSDFPLNQLPQQLSGDAHLILVNNPDFYPEGDFGLMNGLVDNRSPKLTYANIAVLHPRLFLNCKPGHFKLGPLLHHAIAQQRVSGEHYQGEWFNVGTAAQLAELEKHLAK